MKHCYCWTWMQIHLLGAWHNRSDCQSDGLKLFVSTHPLDFRGQCPMENDQVHQGSWHRRHGGAVAIHQQWHLQ